MDYPMYILEILYFSLRYYNLNSNTICYFIMNIIHNQITKSGVQALSPRISDHYYKQISGAIE